MTINVVDLFSGPGGLGEGFAALDNGKAFRIAVSAEMEHSAHKTLVLRAFFRLTIANGDAAGTRAYYNFCNNEDAPHPGGVCPTLWALAQSEAQQLTLGEPQSNAVLDAILKKKSLLGDRTVLIGGPPCQAYSLVGRSRNKGKSGYRPEDDHRHFLYREYLRIVAELKPAVFVMENVKGILTSRVAGRRIFHDILRDLSEPVLATSGQPGTRYAIHSLVLPTRFEAGMEATEIRPDDFVVESERFGIPQARHRVILVGVREDLRAPVGRLRSSGQVTVWEALRQLPALRSKLSRHDTAIAWQETVQAHCGRPSAAARLAGDISLSDRLNDLHHEIRADRPVGGLRFYEALPGSNVDIGSRFEEWVRSKHLNVWLNHEARSHMPSDLARYLYASAFTEIHCRSPKGHREFALPGLAPAHANWTSGKFVDRFRVQRYASPSNTVTSHIAKDGHYFIHPAPAQCRSLTVREAARLQTFPDDYFFQGNRTQQYHQVGNAVPPLLAWQIAEIVKAAVDG